MFIGTPSVTLTLRMTRAVDLMHAPAITSFIEHMYGTLTFLFLGESPHHLHTLCKGAATSAFRQVDKRVQSREGAFSQK